MLTLEYFAVHITQFWIAAAEITFTKKKINTVGRILCIGLSIWALEKGFLCSCCPANSESIFLDSPLCPPKGKWIALLSSCGRSDNLTVHSLLATDLYCGCCGHHDRLFTWDSLLIWELSGSCGSQDGVVTSSRVSWHYQGFLCWCRHPPMNLPQATGTFVSAMACSDSHLDVQSRPLHQKFWVSKRMYKYSQWINWILDYTPVSTGSDSAQKLLSHFPANLVLMKAGSDVL